MSEEIKKVLSMVSEGKITVDEGERLISAMNKATESAEGVEATGERKVVKKVVTTTSTSSTDVPSFLYVKVEPKDEEGDRVKIKVPFGILKSGIKLASFLPTDVQEKVNNAMENKGVNFDMSKIDSKNFDEVLVHLKELNLDVDSKNERVKIYCE